MSYGPECPRPRPSFRSVPPPPITPTPLNATLFETKLSVGRTYLTGRGGKQRSELSHLYLVVYSRTGTLGLTPRPSSPPPSPNIRTETLNDLPNGFARNDNSLNSPFKRRRPRITLPFRLEVH